MPGIEEIRTMGERNVIKAALLGAGTVGSLSLIHILEKTEM